MSNIVLLQLSRVAVALAVNLLVTAGASSQQASEPPSEPARPAMVLGRGGTDTPRYVASAVASKRAVAICSGLWSGNQTMADIDLFSPLPPEHAARFKTAVDEDARTVSITYVEDMPPRIVVWRPVLGCAQLPIGARMEDKAHLPQVSPDVRPPSLDAEPWPLGDRAATQDLPRAKQSKLNAVVGGAFDGATYAGRTWGVIVVSGGKIVAERYALGYDLHKGGQTHSAAKSFAATVLGIAVERYGMDIHAPGALAEWRRPGDPRSAITADNLLRMNSGLYGEGVGSPQPDIYFSGGSVAEHAGTNILHTLPGTRFVYNPPDTMLLLRAVRQAVGNDEKFWALPFTELFWKIGMTRTTTSSDWNGDFLMSGQTYSTARDFARFGLLYLHHGVFNGERLLPEGWDRLVSTAASVQPEGKGPGYGGQFWLYGERHGLPAGAYAARGALGQFIMIVPSHNLVIVRRSYDVAGAFPLDTFTADVIEALF